MTRIRTIPLVLACACALALSGCGEEGPKASAETSPGGLAYTLIRLPGNEYVSMQLAWATDWAYRPEVNQAAPHVGAELIMAGGAEGFPAGEVVERFADMDSEGYLTATLDHVFGGLTFDREDMAETLEIANAHLRAPTLDEGWFLRIRDGLGQNIAEAAALPANAGHEAIRWAVFGDAPPRDALSLDAPGLFEGLTPADVAAWHGATITRLPAAVVVAGDLSPAEAGEALDTLLAGLPGATPPAAPAAAPDYSPRRILLHLPEATTAHLTFVAQVPPTRLGGDFEDLVILNALGGDDQSVLFEAVRTGLRASYGFGAGVANYTREQRVLFLTGEIEGARIAEAEEVVRAAYADFRAAGPTGPLAERKAPLEAHFSDMSEYVIDQANSELQSALDGFAPGRSLGLMDEIAAVTEAGIAERLATAYPEAGDFLVIAVSPDATALPGACVITEPRQAADCR